jgi:hypothetical protein
MIGSEWMLHKRVIFFLFWDAVIVGDQNRGENNLLASGAHLGTLPQVGVVGIGVCLALNKYGSTRRVAGEERVAAVQKSTTRWLRR